MRRFVCLAVLLFFTVPFGASLAGCGSKTVTVFCNGQGSGPAVGQVSVIQLSPNFATFGESVNFGQIGSSLSASAFDCKNNPVSVSKFTYATSDMTFADVNPSTGQVCGGSWNRNTGGGIPDFTLCTAPVNSQGTPPVSKMATITATAQGGVSNGFVVYVHPIVTSIVIGPPTPTNSTSPITGYNVTAAGVVFATSNIPPPTGNAVTLSGFPATSNAFNTLTLTITSGGVSSFTVANTFSLPIGKSSTDQGLATSVSPSCATSGDLSSNCCPVTSGAIAPAPLYTGNACISQNATTQIAARAYQNGTTNPADNITCQVGHLQYSAQNAQVLTIDQNGVATASQPGSTILTATIANSGTGGTAGFFATCPPASIQLAVPGSTTPTSATVNVGTSQPLIATVLDTNGTQLTGVNLTFTSTSPSTIPAGGGTIVPSIPGAAAITASCQPPGCNPAPFDQTGLYGNGEPITSNDVVITAPGNNSTVLYMASTNSQYLRSIDFSQTQQSALVKLPYQPTSMVITQDGSTIYLGSNTALMTVSAATNTVSSVNQAITGSVLSVSPDGSTLAVTDPVRQTISLVSSSGTVTSQTGGIGISAQWTADSQTVYVAAQNNQLAVHSSYSGWLTTPTDKQYLDVAVTVPGVGAFFATNGNITQARSYCPVTTVKIPGNPPTFNSTYYPTAGDTNVQIDKVAATEDGNHILGATTSVSPAVLRDIAVQLKNLPAPNNPLACTTTSASTPVTFTTNPGPPVSLTGIAAMAITGVVPASNSALAFVTYTGTGGQLPIYVPATGSISNVALSSGAIAPVAGVFSTDNSTFYVGTSGDNQVHLITVTGTSAADSSVLAPNLPDFQNNNNTATPNLLVQRPRKATS